MADDNATRAELLKEVVRLEAEVARLKAGTTDRDMRYRDLVELAADAIFVGDPAGTIIDANQSAAALTGYALDELLGMNLGALFSREEIDRAPLRYDLLKAGRTIQSERMLTRKDGRLVPVGMNSRRMPDGTYHTFMRDFTERRENERRMQALVRDLETFSYTVSHDLRVHLTSILLPIEILEERCRELRDDQSGDLLRVVRSGAEDMLSLIENLLALARTEQATERSEPIACGRVLDMVLDDLAPRLERAAVSVEAAELPAVTVPEIFIRQVFLNLIGNALNYACAECKVIRVGGEQRGRRVVLSVRDHGPGVPEGEADRVFDLFYRGAVSGAHVGSGIGLAIVAKIADAFGGSAWLEETPGGGCTFCVEFDNIC